MKSTGMILPSQTILLAIWKEEAFFKYENSIFQYQAL